MSSSPFKDTRNFEELVRSSFSETVSSVLGQETCKAVSFYFDISLLAKEPEIFAGLLERLFGRTAEVLEKMMSEKLIAKVGVKLERREGADFHTLIRIARAKFLSSLSQTGIPQRM